MSESKTAQEAEQQETETGSTLESIDDYKSALEKARSDAAKYRTRSKEFDSLKSKYEQTSSKAEKLDKLISELTGEDEPDPEKLKSQISAKENEAERLRLENKVIRLASKHKADDELLFAYLDKKGLLDGDLEKNIEKALEDKPSLKLNGAVNTGDTTDGSKVSSKSSWNSFIRKQL